MSGGAGYRARFIRRLGRLAARLVYRDIDVHLAPGLTAGGPVLAVSNHFGGLSDGVLLVDSLPRMPRIVARDVIWRVPVVGAIASQIGMIPVHRAADGGPTGNDEMFASAYRALAEGELVLIFPEGVTQDVPHMATVRTGAARIVLGARRSGVAGIRVLPVGIHYEDKAGIRSRALVNVGQPVDLDAWSAERPGGVPDGAEDRAAVTDLTELIDARLRMAAPDFPDWPTADDLAGAAEVLLNDVDQAPIRYGDRELLAGRLNRAGEPGRTALVEVSGRYREQVHRARTADRTIATAGSAKPRSRQWLLDLVLVLLLLPYAVLGLIAALLPVLAVTLTQRLPVAPAVRASLVPGVALLTYLLELGVLAWRGFGEGGWQSGVLVLLLFPFLVAAMLLVQERGASLWRRWRRSRRPAPADLKRLATLRAEVSERAWGAL